MGLQSEQARNFARDHDCRMYGERERGMGASGRAGRAQPNARARTFYSEHLSDDGRDAQHRDEQHERHNVQNIAATETKQQGNGEPRDARRQEHHRQRLPFQHTHSSGSEP
jgi:hypothetical protein